MTPSPGKARRVVYLAGNDILSDARVLKYCDAAAGLGYDVHAVGVTRSGPGFANTTHGFGLTVVGVPQTLVAKARSALRQVAVVMRWRYSSQAELFAARGQVTRWRTSARDKRGPKSWILSALAGVGSVVVAIVGAWSRKATATDADRSWDPVQHRVEVDRYLADRRFSWTHELGHIVRDGARVGAVIDSLEPDVIHVHDVFMIAAACDARARAAAHGRDVPVVYDSHEYVHGLSHLEPRVTASYTDLERRYIDEVAATITVSEPLADLLAADYPDVERPAVVLNAPRVVEPAEGFATLREAIALPDERCMVYVGGVNEARGVATAVRALVDLPDLHLAVVTNRVNVVVNAFLELAKELGVADRVHLADYVRPEYVAHYLDGIDVGLSTLLHSPNHDVAVTNKFCEYLQAGIPIVTSDTPAQASLVTELDLGAVYTAGDVGALVVAVNAVLDRQAELGARISQDAKLRRRFSWAAQVDVIESVYDRVLGEARAGGGAT